MHFLQASFHESTYHNMFVDCIAGFAIAQINSAAQTFTQAHTRTHTHIYNIHTQTHTHTHTHTHTDTHTHKYTHIQYSKYSNAPLLSDLILLCKST